MNILKTAIITILVLGTASVAFSNDFDWSRFRRQVQNCPSTDAHCVGLTMINIMQEVHGSGNPGTVSIKCACGNEGMGCYLKRQNGGITQINGKIAFTFNSKCEKMIPFAQTKGAFCDDGPEENPALWLINTQRAAFTKMSDFTFASDCKKALEEL